MRRYLCGFLIVAMLPLAVLANAVTAPSAGAATTTRGQAMGFAITLPSNADIDRAAAQGVKWLRIGYQWDWITGNPPTPNTDPATWNWTEYAGIISRAHTDGIKVLTVAEASPYWANGRAYTSNASNNGFYYPDVAHLSNWMDYVNGMVTRGADAVEVWNEQNDVAYVKGEAPNAAKQAGLQRYTYDHMKPLFPTVPLITGGLAAGASDATFGNYCTQASAPGDPAQYLLNEYVAAPAVYNSGRSFAGSFDGIGYHPYSDEPLGARPPTYCYNGAARTQDLFNISSFIRDAKPMWLTESGVMTDGPGGVGETAAATRYDQYFQEFDALRTAGVPIANYISYSLNDGPDPTNDFNDRFGVFDLNGNAEPASFHILLQAAINDRDGTPPVIASSPAIKETDLAWEPTVATVTWTTDEPSTSSVEFDLTKPSTGGSYARVAGSGALTTSHSVTLSRLTPGKTYHYRVVSTDAWGNMIANTVIGATDKTFGAAKGLNKTGTNVQTITSSTFSTPSAGLVVAFVGASGDTAQHLSFITGGGLIWGFTPAVSSRVHGGTTEVWSAQASGPLTNVNIAVTMAEQADQQLTVMFFPPDLFASNPTVVNPTAANGTGTTLAVSVPSVAQGSLVLGVAHDPSSATKGHGVTNTQTAPNQPLRNYNFAGTATQSWVQGLVALNAGTAALQNANASPADPWDYAAVEVRY